MISFYRCQEFYITISFRRWSSIHKNLCHDFYSIFIILNLALYPGNLWNVIVCGSPKQKGEKKTGVTCRFVLLHKKYIHCYFWLCFYKISCFYCLLPFFTRFLTHLMWLILLCSYFYCRLLNKVLCDFVNFSNNTQYTINNIARKNKILVIFLLNIHGTKFTPR